MQDPGVLQRLQDRVLEYVWVEGVFVWGLVSANSRLETFLFAEQVVHQAQVTAWDGYPAGDIDGLVEGELDPFDQMEGNGIFKTTICVCEVSRLFLLSLSYFPNQGVGLRTRFTPYINWNRILARSRALEGSERLTAESILVCEAMLSANQLCFSGC